MNDILANNPQMSSSSLINPMKIPSALKPAIKSYLATDSEWEATMVSKSAMQMSKGVDEIIGASRKVSSNINDSN